MNIIEYFLSNCIRESPHLLIIESQIKNNIQNISQEFVRKLIK